MPQEERTASMLRRRKRTACVREQRGALGREVTEGGLQATTRADRQRDSRERMRDFLKRVPQHSNGQRREKEGRSTVQERKKVSLARELRSSISGAVAGKTSQKRCGRTH